MTRILIAATSVLLVVFLGFASLARSPGTPRNQVFLGEILLPGGQTAEAVHVRQGRIIAIGERDSVLAGLPWGTRRIELEDGTLIAGLIEPHTHPLATALLGAAVDIGGISHDSREAILNTLERASQDPGPSPWIVAFGWDPAMIDGLTPPSLAELDAIAPDRPLIILTQMMHEAFINSAALDAAGLGPDTADPLGGVFERDPSGALTGRIIEVPAIRAVMAAAPETPDAALEYLLHETYSAYARAGYTTIGVASVVGRARDPLALLATVSLQDHPALNTVLYTSPERFDQARAQWQDTPQEDALRQLAGIKFWMDGSPYVGGAALAEPYVDSRYTRMVLRLSADWHGELLTDARTARDHLIHAQRGGYQVAIHAQGERAIDAALDAIEAARNTVPNDALSHRLEHVALITPEQMQRAERLGVSLGFFVDHIRFYGHMLPELVGESRTARYMPVATAETLTGIVTLHGDHPATPIDAVRVFTTAVERRSHIGDAVITPSERISRLAALDMMTIQAARQLGIGAETGSIEVGKRADFTWLSGNPLTEPLDTLEVRASWVSGRRVDTRNWSLRALGYAARAALALAFS